MGIERSETVVSRVITHTYPELLGSIRILERCDFTLAGPGAEAGTLRYIRSSDNKQRQLGSQDAPQQRVIPSPQS